MSNIAHLRGRWAEVFGEDYGLDYGPQQSFVKYVESLVGILTLLRGAPALMPLRPRRAAISLGIWSTG